ncbi:MAG: DUF3267 domain-containing protein [Bacteroidetes bacterium]|nr:DUF3267 domain-containing protein [Bacteroidota bacterium]
MTGSTNGREFTYSSHRIRRFSLIILCLSFLFFGIPLLILYGYENFYKGIIRFIFTPAVTIPLIIAGILAHELIHLVCFVLLGRVPVRNTRIGLGTAPLTPYVHCGIPVKVWVYLTSSIAPAGILGFLPILWSLISGNTSVFVFGLIFMVGAGADLIITRDILRISMHHQVQDHPEKPGFTVIDQ